MRYRPPAQPIGSRRGRGPTVTAVTPNEGGPRGTMAVNHYRPPGRTVASTTTVFPTIPRELTMRLRSFHFRGFPFRSGMDY